MLDKTEAIFLIRIRVKWLIIYTDIRCKDILVLTFI